MNMSDNDTNVTLYGAGGPGSPLCPIDKLLQQPVEVVADYFTRVICDQPFLIEDAFLCQLLLNMSADGPDCMPAMIREIHSVVSQSIRQRYPHHSANPFNDGLDVSLLGAGEIELGVCP